MVPGGHFNFYWISARMGTQHTRVVVVFYWYRAFLHGISNVWIVSESQQVLFGPAAFVGIGTWRPRWDSIVTGHGASFIRSRNISRMYDRMYDRMYASNLNRILSVCVNSD